ncbi:signal peptide peptidase A. Serine peptidase. MEROPS family S49 [Friedmanniella luteola]|uniref:Signal peptide peptidase A. Serine peptidase. MEROPS family S49 n=1 Tax=Friedmanniella luteola TaxID=546871 RepID=A0A1H1LXF0_9ACTN|nr:signal peptide peptidase SppA [Friedmanniella luteola]SDR78479.1 signal peptide peptidase A. Serine peptidase. MEROPS family S49 [Friedmanniella luteola]
MPSLPGTRTPLLLELDLTDLPVDPDPGDPLARLRTRGKRLLRPTLRALHEAADDPRVAGLVARVGGPLPWAAAQELRIGVQAFAASGKPTVAWAESFGEVADTASYVLATAFGTVWLQPGGGVGLLGVAAETTFLGGALAKLGVQPEFEQRHEYKNAVDTFTRTGFTEAHRASLEGLTSSLLDEAVGRVAAGRGLGEERVRELVDTGPRTAAEALEVGLVDRLGYRDQVYAALRAEVGEEAELLFADRWSPRRTLPALPWSKPGRVALVRAHGGIGSGRSRRGPMGRQLGSDSVAAELRAALADDQVKAVVLHVDSPGGSAVASETIWREVCRVRESGRTVVVSMGALAASGGYYIAAPADVIVALPATLTGSIGVFGGKFVVSDLLDRAGLTTGAVQQGEHARMYSSRRPFGEQERERLAATVDAIYDDFVGKVAAGRGRPVAEVEPLARGRVWTGREARERGLVDELGGLQDAVRIARERAGLPDDAPVGPAVHLPPAARIGRARNSEDPRAASAVTAWPGLTDLTRALGLPAGAELTMPALRLR